MVRDGQTVFFNTSLILDAAHSSTLVDTGLPGQFDALVAALAETGVRVADLKRIILTHQDIDHVGSLHDLVQASGAQVLAHATEAPFIDGTQLPHLDDKDRLAARYASPALPRNAKYTAAAAQMPISWYHVRADLGGNICMASVRTLLAKLFVVVTLALGPVSRVVVLLDVLHQPFIARVLLTRRRTLEYNEFFTLRDRDGRRAAPIARAANSVLAHRGADTVHDGAADRYITVQTA